jgi:myo-inositol-1-phosphate synthase
MYIDIRLNTVDAPNAGSILLDVIRAMKIAMDRGLSGSIASISNYAFKNTIDSLSPEMAEKRFAEFINGDKTE